MLTTTAMQDADLDNAVAELMDNARRLAVGGFAGEAWQALGLLQQSGPWRLPAHGTLTHQLKRLLPPVSFLAGETCPAIGEQDSIPVERHAAWSEQEAAEQIRSLALVGRNQLKPAGADWSHDFLSTLADRRGKPGDDRPHAAFGAFCVDAEFVLKARIAQRFGGSIASEEIPSADDLAALGLSDDDAATMLAQLQRANRVEIAPTAEAIDTRDVVRAVSNYLHATGFGGGYLSQFIFLASWLLLVEERRNLDAVEAADAWFTQDKDAFASIIDFAAVPSVAHFLRQGQLAQAAQVNAEAAQGWLADLKSRRATETKPSIPHRLEAPVLQTAEAFLAALQGTPLQSLRWLALPVPDSAEQAWVTPIPAAERHQLWQEARALVEQTGRWPLVTILWSVQDDPPDANRLAEDLFMRFPYESGPARDDISPRSFVETSHAIHVDEFLAQLSEREYLLEDESQLQIWKDELSAAEVPLDGFDKAWAACGGDRTRFEAWLAQQEAKHGRADPELGRQPEFDPDNAWLVLLPTPHGEEALAYMHWYGIERDTADGFISLLRAWRERHGAELFAHYGTMLEFAVPNPPMDFDLALRLAREHELAAPCTLMLPGIPLRRYALGLMGHGTWFLHERP